MDLLGFFWFKPALSQPLRKTRNAVDYWVSVDASWILAWVLVGGWRQGQLHARAGRQPKEPVLLQHRGLESVLWTVW